MVLAQDTIKGCLGQGSGGCTGVPLRSQTCPCAPTPASLGFPTTWLPPGREIAFTVAEGLVDGVSVLLTTWLFCLILGVLWCLCHSLLVTCESPNSTDVRGRDTDPTSWCKEHQGQMLEEQVGGGMLSQPPLEDRTVPAALVRAESPSPYVFGVISSRFPSRVRLVRVA